MQVRIDRAALEQQPVLEPAQPVIGRKVSSPELSALAGKYINLQHRSLFSMGDAQLEQLCADVRRLAASVLSQDESK